MAINKLIHNGKKYSLIEKDGKLQFKNPNIFINVEGYKNIKDLKLSKNNIKYNLKKCGRNLYKFVNNDIDIYYNETKNNITNIIDNIPNTSKGKYKLESFSIVCDNIMKEECLLLLKSIRKFHKQPILLLCDKKTKKFISKNNIKNIYFLTNINDKNISNKIKNVKKINNFHKPNLIFKKMDIIKYALSKYKSTMFFDADIILLKKLPSSFCTKIVLSPHYHKNKHFIRNIKYGFFNAGYLFCADKSFPDWWQKKYIEGYGFYEQSCMDFIYKFFDVSKFDEKHNVGIWREYLEEEFLELNPSSVHIHMINNNFDDEWLTEKTKKMKLYLNKLGYE